MERQEQKWLSILSDKKISELIEDISNPIEIINLFFIKDKINIDLFIANLMYLEAGMPELYQGEHEPTPCIFHFGTRGSRPFGYPKWFIAAYPDVVLWIAEKIKEDENNLYKLTNTDENYFKNNSNFIDGLFANNLLRAFLEKFSNETNNFECSLKPEKLETITGSIMGDSMLSDDMKVLMLIEDGDKLRENPEGCNAALIKYSKAIEIKPSEILFLKRAETYFLMDMIQNAMTEVDLALKYNPKFIKAYVFRGGIYYKQLNNRKEACADLKRAADLGDLKAKEIYERLVKTI